LCIGVIPKQTWNIGLRKIRILEYWNVGLHHSNIPVFQGFLEEEDEKGRGRNVVLSSLPHQGSVGPEPHAFAAPFDAVTEERRQPQDCLQEIFEERQRET
jgi:hypothetical protein